ncbi:MAG TPA: EamA family transporter [Acidimicrobiales bacterium]
MSRRGWILFVAMSVIWGTPYLLIRIAVREVSPATLIFLRTAPAALILLPLAIHRAGLGSLWGRWRWIVAYTAAELAIPWLFIGRAEIHLTSSFTGLLIATVPLVGAVIYRVLGYDRFDRRRILGLIIGFGGVAALVGANLQATDLGAVFEVIIPTIGYAIGPLVISRRLGDLPGLAVTTASLVLAGLVYAPFGLTHLPSHISGEVIAAIAGLALVCTALAFVLFFELIVEVGPARSTVITYVNPAVAILLGVLILGEPLTVGIVVGFPLILYGSWMATTKSAPATDELAAEPPSS